MNKRSENLLLYVTLLCLLTIDASIAGEHWYPVFSFLALIVSPLIATDLKSYCGDAYGWLRKLFNEFLGPYFA